jgi:hypothetical protein
MPSSGGIASVIKGPSELAGGRTDDGDGIDRARPLRHRSAMETGLHTGGAADWHRAGGPRRTRRTGATACTRGAHGVTRQEGQSRETMSALAPAGAARDRIAHHAVMAASA